MPKTGIIRMLSVLFADNMDIKAKITVLENEYNIKMSEEIEEKVERMCNLSEGVYEKGKFEQLVDCIKNLMSAGMNFDDIVKVLKINSEYEKKIKDIFDSKS